MSGQSKPSTHRAARLLLSVLFLVSGIGKLGSVKDTQAYMEAYGVPGYLLWPAAALEISGGMMLLANVHIPTVATVLSGWCLLTASIFHTDLKDQTQQIMFMKNLAMAGGFLVLADASATKDSDVGSMLWNALQACLSKPRRQRDQTTVDAEDEASEKTGLLANSTTV